MRSITCEFEASLCAGIQAQLWTETVRTRDQLDFMLLPRLLAAAERAWSIPSWEKPGSLNKPVDWDECSLQWYQFATILGQQEMERLEKWRFKPYLPPPGARYESDGCHVVHSEISYAYYVFGGQYTSRE